jgi:hypothetical protein
MSGYLITFLKEKQSIISILETNNTSWDKIRTRPLISPTSHPLSNIFEKTSTTKLKSPGDKGSPCLKPLPVIKKSLSTTAVFYYSTSNQRKYEPDHGARASKTELARSGDPRSGRRQRRSIRTAARVWEGWTFDQDIEGCGARRETRAEADCGRRRRSQRTRGQKRAAAPITKQRCLYRDGVMSFHNSGEDRSSIGME